MTKKAKSPEECHKLLVVAKPGFAECIQKAQDDLKLDEKEKLTILYYLEAVVILRHLQRPGVIQNLTVSKIFSTFYSTQPLCSLHPPGNL